jgi:hypothetical protein
MLLLLNKCDLVPPAACAAWKAWLEARYPGLTVLPVSAAPGPAAARTQREVLHALLATRVPRGGDGGSGGGSMAVADIVGLTLGESPGAGRERSLSESLVAVGAATHAAATLGHKASASAHPTRPPACPPARHHRPPARPPAPTDEVIAESLRRNTHAKRYALPSGSAAVAGRLSRGAEAAGGGAGGGTGGGDRSSSEEEEEEEGQEATWSVKGTKAAKKEAQRRKRRAQQHRGRGAGSAHALAAAATAVDSEDEDWERSGSGGSEPAGSGSDEEDAEDAALREEVEALTLEARVASITVDAAPGAPGAGEPGGRGGRTSAPAPRRVRVVVGLVGEPNVGKSSTLNALLGSHRVAVSSHPGRTKHYQTHYVCDRLVLCDCPGLVFPRLDVSLPMQVGTWAGVGGHQAARLAACRAGDSGKTRRPLGGVQCGVE